MKFADAHPLLFAIMCLPFLICGFVLTVSAVLHLIKYVADSLTWCIWEIGAVTQKCWHRLNKTTVYCPDDRPQKHEPFFMPGALGVVIKIALTYFVAWILRIVIMGLIS